MAKIKGSNIQLENIDTINDVPVEDLGSGGGDGGNYLTAGSNANTQADVDLYTRYVDSAGNNPIDGQGGSPNITWTRNTTDPLNLPADFLLTKDAFNRQGQGVSIPFSIENRHLATVLQISGDAILRSGIYTNRLWNVQATYSVTSNVVTVTLPNTFTTGTLVTVMFETGGATALSNTFTLTGATSTTFTFALTTGNTSGNCKVFYVGDLRASIIEDPSGTPVVNEPVGTDIQLAVIGNNVKFLATFQTSKIIKNYRLCIHVSGSTSNAFSVSFSNIKVWEQEKNYGSLQTQFRPYTATITNLGTSTQNLSWRRNGQVLEIVGKITAGTIPAGQVATVSFPNGFVSDSTVYSGINFIGRATRSAGTAHQSNIINTAGSGTFTFTAETTANALTQQNASTVISDGETISIWISVVIQGLGSNIALSSDAGSGRPVVGAYSGHTGVSLTTDVTTLKFNTRLKDSHSIYNTSTGEVVIPNSGDYVFILNRVILTSSNASIFVWKNGINTGLTILDLSTLNNSGSLLVPNLNSGDVITFRCNSSITTTTDTGASLTFFKINSGSQILARDEDVFVEAYNSTNRTTDSSTNLRWDTVTRDTHGAMNTTNGVFTAPVSGFYHYTAFLNLSSGGGANYWFLVKNGSTYKGVGFLDNDSVSAGIYLLAGETLAIRNSASKIIAGGTLSSPSVASVTIFKV